MVRRDVIAVGTSSGGVKALSELAAVLPADLPAAVLVVMHMSPVGPSILPQIVDAAGPLRARPARNGEELEPGRIYVAVPDHHLMVEGENLRLSQGPRESHARPSVDVLFRSAAYFLGRRVIGVVLTGQLDDGTAGLWAVKDRGGITIAQAPEEALYPSMPLSALKHGIVDHTLRIHEMGDMLQALTREALPELEQPAMDNDPLSIETRISLEDNALELGVRKLGAPSFHTCPDCGGSMVGIVEGPNTRFRCHTGHAFTQRALAHQRASEIEKTLWSALAQLEELQMLLGEINDSASEARLETRRAQLCQLINEVRSISVANKF